MGGNSKAINRETNAIIAYAERVSLLEISRERLCETTTQLLSKINKAFFAKFHFPLWRGSPQFSGSSRHLFDVSISTDELLKHKPSVGDIDVMISSDHLEKLFQLLIEFEGIQLLPNVTYLGQNVSALRGSQINSVFKIDNKYVQIDFEGVEFVNGMPTCFSKFAHSSDWNDVKLGIKGLGHKYLLMMLAWTVMSTDNVVVLTEKSSLSPHKARIKVQHTPVRMLSFSVDNGLRVRLERQRDFFGNDIMINGKIAYKEIDISKSTYEKDLRKIFQSLFNVEPSEDELRSFWSFHGLMDLCSTYVSEKTLISMFEQLVTYKLFGQGQKLDRDSALIDKDVKLSIIKSMIEKFPFLSRSNVDVQMLMNKYYSCYAMRNND
jgi:hypothetical protein